MTHIVTYGSGTKDDPWLLKTPSLSSEYRAWREPEADPPRSSSRSARRASRTVCRQSTTWLECSRSGATGFPLAMPTKASL